MVNNAINTVKQTFWKGNWSYYLSWFYSLGNFRAGLIVGFCYTSSHALYDDHDESFGVSGNLMNLGALDFDWWCIDGAVIM